MDVNQSPSRRKASTTDNNPSPQKRKKTNVEDPFPVIRSTVEHHHSSPAPYQPSADRLLILTSLKAKFDSDAQRIRNQTALRAAATPAKKKAYTESIAAIQRYMQRTIAAMSFVHVMTDTELQSNLTVLRERPETFAQRFIRQYSEEAESIFNYCKFKLVLPTLLHLLTFWD